MTDVLSISDGAFISRYNNHCQGSRDQNRYFLGLNVSAAKVVSRFSHPGSSNLDEICAFDLAETSEMNLGQLNLIRVSSFCGPEGIIWGYDAARPAGLCDKPVLTISSPAQRSIPVYDGNPMMDAASELFGTVGVPRYPIMPGSHTMAAYKSIEARGPSVIYAAFGLGIPTDRRARAAILMEDVGTVPKLNATNRRTWRKDLARSMAESVTVIASNQRTQCAAIFFLYREIDLGKHDVGCAVSLAPYFTIARKAIPHGDFDGLRGLSLEAWRNAVIP